MLGLLPWGIPHQLRHGTPNCCRIFHVCTRCIPALRSPDTRVMCMIYAGNDLPFTSFCTDAQLRLYVDHYVQLFRTKASMLDSLCVQRVQQECTTATKPSEVNEDMHTYLYVHIHPRTQEAFTPSVLAQCH